MVDELWVVLGEFATLVGAALLCCGRVWPSFSSCMCVEAMEG